MKKTWYFLAMALLVLGLALLAGGAATVLGRWARPSRTTLDARDFVSGIPALEPDLKLVVARLDLVKTASAESRKTAWGVDWGTTKATLSVPARVHYALDLSGAEPVRLEADAKTGTVTAVFPEPEASAVEVFSQNRRAVVEPGWGRLAAFSGAGLLDALDRGLYMSLRRQASAPAMLAQVKTQAEGRLAGLVRDYVARASGKKPARVIVVFAAPNALARR